MSLQTKNYKNEKLICPCCKKSIDKYSIKKFEFTGEVDLICLECGDRVLFKKLNGDKYLTWDERRCS